MAFPWGIALASGAIVILVLLALHRPLLALIGGRHAFRRPRQLAIVSIGLMVGTAILTGANVAGDSFQASAVDGVERRLGAIDALVERSPPRPLTEWADLVADPTVRPHLEQHTLVLSARGSIEAPRTQLGEPDIAIRGIDPATYTPLARLRALQGTLPADLAAWGPQHAVINKALATELEAQDGDTLSLYVINAQEGTSVERQLVVVAVIADDGSDPYGNGPVVLLARPVLARALALGDDGADILFASAAPDSSSKTLEAALETAVATSGGGFTRDIRGDELRYARGEGFLRFMFLALGSFSIFAGLFLIVSLMAMLIDERKADLATMRATGTIRGEVTQLQLHEGLVYGLGGMVLGIVVGIALAAMLVAGASTFSFYQGETLRLAVLPSTIATSAGIGLFVTLVVMGIAAHRAGGFHIAHALRGESATTKGGRRGALLFGLLAVVGGAGASALALVGGDPWLAILGPTALAFGLSSISDRFLPRSAGGVVWLAWVIYIGASFFLLDELDNWEFLTFPLRGVLLVLGGAVVLVRSGLPPRIAALLARPWRRIDPVADPAFAYVRHRPARTVLTVTMVGLVVLILVVLGTMFGMFGATVTDDSWAGYDVVGTSRLEVPAGAGAHDVFDNATRVVVLPAAKNGLFATLEVDEGFWTETPDLVAVTPAAVSAFRAPAVHLADGYADMEAALRAVSEDPGLGIVSDYLWIDNSSSSRGGGELLPGDVARLRGDDDRLHEVTIVAVLDSKGFGGFLLHPDLLSDLGTPVGSKVYAKSAAGVDPGALARQIERTFRASGMEADPTRERIEAQQRDARTQLVLLQTFVGMGLLVGVASTGIVTARNVFERRREVGVMRAIGYGRGDIVRVFLLEAVYVVVVAAAVGIAGGLLTAYGMYKVEMESWGIDFEIPYLNLALVAGVVLVTTLVAAWFPAVKASRILPAEATRNVD